MDLTGQLSNLSASLEKLLALPLARSSERVAHDGCPQLSIFRQRPYEQVRDALIQELAAEDAGLRMAEIRRRIEGRLGKPVAHDRFRDYVNSQSKGANPLLERLGWGIYRLRS